MPFYLRTPPDHKPVFARLTRHGKFHAFYQPYGWPIKLCTWVGGGGLSDFLETADAPTCKNCIRDLRTIPGQIALEQADHLSESDWSTSLLHPNGAKQCLISESYRTIRRFPRPSSPKPRSN